MDIRITTTTAKQKKAKPVDESNLGFGEYFTDHIFLMNYEVDKGWQNPRVEPYTNLSIDPAAMGIHYGQEIFEGMKAYRGANGKIHLFRPRDNFKRLNRSAIRLCMPEVDIDTAMEGMRQLITIDKDWIPSSPGTSLYIRPVMLATEPHVGVRPSRTYLFYIIVGPVGAYYKEGLNPVRIYVEPEFIRAAIGGVGDAKTAANYAASLMAAEKAKEKGFAQVLWLDAKEHQFVEEVGTMNIFFVINEEVITPPLSGSILPGITRDSVITILKNRGMTLIERPIRITEIIAAAKNGSLREVFGTGTAAVISPVGQITYKDQDIVVNDGKMGDLSQSLYYEIAGIQYGGAESYGWCETIS